MITTLLNKRRIALIQLCYIWMGASLPMKDETAYLLYIEKQSNFTLKSLTDKPLKLTSSEEGALLQKKPLTPQKINKSVHRCTLTARTIHDAHSMSNARVGIQTKRCNGYIKLSDDWRLGNRLQ